MEAKGEKVPNERVNLNRLQDDRLAWTRTDKLSNAGDALCLELDRHACSFRWCKMQQNKI